MIIYSFLFGLITVSQFVTNKIQEKKLLLLLFLLLFAVSAVRFDVGVDYKNYQQFMLMEEVQRFEPFGLLMYKIDSFLFGGKLFPTFFASHAFLALIGIYKFILTLSVNKRLSLLLFFCLPVLYFSTFNIVRQWAAVGLLYWITADYIGGKSLRSMWVRIVLVPFVHLSSLFMIVVLGVASRKWSLIHFILFAALALSSLRFLFQYLLGSKYGFYVKHALFSNEPYSLQLFIYPILLCMFSLTIAINGAKSVKLNVDAMIIRLSVIAALLVVVSIYFGVDEQIITRLSTYFFPLLIVLIPQVISVSGRARNWIYICVLAVASILFFRLILLNGEIYSLVPYRTFFSFL